MRSRSAVRCGVALAALVLNAGGCKKKSAEPVATAEPEPVAPVPVAPVDPVPAPEVRPTPVDPLAEFNLQPIVSRACACKTPDCTRSVEGERIVWLDRYQGPARGGLEAELAKLEACLVAARRAGAPATAEQIELPGAYEGDVALARLVHDAKAYLAAAYPDVAIVTINAQYLRASGVVDPKYGVVIIETGVAKGTPVDDPDRPTGAPVPEPEPTRGPPRTQCPFLKWWPNKWSEDLVSCRDRPPLVGPRCTADQIWQRAITDKAPDNAVAVLRLGIPYADRWAFSISDPLRKVSFNRTYRDDCEPASERE